MIRIISITLAAAAVLAAPAAQAASHDRKTFIAEQDLDKDGSVSKEEFAQGRAAEFKRVDTNGDGKLSKDEYVDEFKVRLDAGKVDGGKPGPEMYKKQMDQTAFRHGVLDSNKDGFISPPEFEHSGWGMFMHHDTDNDGAVTAKDPAGGDR